jgi:uracil-DNA glycosylase
MMNDRAALVALLEWYADIGVDETVAPEPVDRFAAAEAPAAIPEAPRPRTPVELPPGPRNAPAHASPAAALGEARQAAAAAATIEDLVAAIAAFEGCALKRTATTTCVFDGNPKARVMLIGEAPGKEEDRQGKPFVGPAGQLLDKMLGAIGLDRQSVYITNTLYWRPPGNRTPTPEEIATCLPFLERQVELIAPAMLVYVGGSAAKAMLEKNEGITRLRGRWFSFEREGRETIPATAIFHPAFLLRQPARKKETWRDLLAIRARLDAMGLAPAATRPES